jgi:hypothetical protein
MQAMSQLIFAFEAEGIKLTSIGVDDTQRLDYVCRREASANARPELPLSGPRSKQGRVRTICGVAVVCRKGEN